MTDIDMTPPAATEEEETREAVPRTVQPPLPAVTATPAQRLAAQRGGGGDMMGAGISFIRGASRNPSERTFQPFDVPRGGPWTNKGWDNDQGAYYNGRNAYNPFEGVSDNAFTKDTAPPPGLWTRNVLVARFWWNNAFPVSSVTLQLKDLTNTPRTHSTDGKSVSTYRPSGFHPAPSVPGQDTLSAAYVFAAPKPCVLAQGTGLAWTMRMGTTAETRRPALGVVDTTVPGFPTVGGTYANGTVPSPAVLPPPDAVWYRSATDGIGLPKLTAPLLLRPAAAAAPTLQFLGYVNMITDGVAGSVQGKLDMTPMLRQLEADYYDIIIVYAVNAAVNWCGVDWVVTEAAASSAYAATGSASTTAAALIDPTDLASHRLQQHVRTSPGYMPYAQTMSADGVAVPVAFG